MKQCDSRTVKINHKKQKQGSQCLEQKCKVLSLVQIWFLRKGKREKKKKSYFFWLSMLFSWEGSSSSSLNLRLNLAIWPML